MKSLVEPGHIGQKKMLDISPFICPLKSNGDCTNGSALGQST